MTDRPARRLSASQALQLGSLDPESYTANRLNHANPEHLYITSRRCFIGPIPEGWLNSHRKEWYKHHLSLNYSSRVATFTAKHSVSNQRRVSGLTRGSSKIGPSFPQPENIAGDIEQEREGDVDPSGQDLEADTIPRRCDPDEDVSQSEAMRIEDGGDTIIDASAPIDDLEENEEGTADEIPAENSEAFGLSISGQEEQDNAPSSIFAKRSASTERNQSLREPNPQLIGSAINEEPAAATSNTSLLRQDSPKPVQEDPPPKQSSPRASGMISRVIHVASRSRGSNIDSPVAQEADNDQTLGERIRSHIRFDPSEDRIRSALLVRARVAQMQLEAKAKEVLKRDFKDGEILKMEKMLVRIDTTPESKLPDDYDENGSQGIVSKTTQKWREYMVVCRQCQKDEDGSPTFVLQIYQTRVIPALDSKKSKRPKHEIPLGGKLSKLNMYSSLDKSLVVWTPDGHNTKIYLFQARCASSSAEWYTFLRGILGWSRAKELLISVPELNVSLRLDNPFGSLSGADGDVAQDEDTFIRNTLAKERDVASTIIKDCLKMLDNAPEWSDVLQSWTNYGRIGLAWKRYDRLEWIHGENEKKMFGTIAMTQSHDLELRPKQHYPTSSHTRKGKQLSEPAPVEGFLIRLTSQKGKHERVGKLFSKRLYFSTHDHYLLFSRPKNAKPPPPPPPRVPLADTRATPSSREIADSIPIIYAVNPYPVKGGEISWIKSPAPTVERNDRDAYDEMIRKVNLVKNSDGFIDLCDVVKVRKVHLGATEADNELVDDDSEVDFDADVEDSTEDDGEAVGLDTERSFELKLKNGLVVRLQAYDKQTKKEWKRRLRELVRYWRHRHAQDIHLFKTVRDQNLEQLQVDEEGEAVLGQFAKKWELGLTHASPELYNMCGISCCRTIHLSGPLYRKPRLHGTFMLNHCMLVPGSLLLFESALRSRTGKVIPHIHHSKFQHIDLADCYLYSGLLTEGDLLYQNRTFDSNSPGHHALPRMWPEDGWNSRDEDVMTCFVLWRPSGKSWFRAPGEGKAATLKRVSALGKKGNRMVFRARSRAERDHWVLGIAAEIERSLGKEDVRIEGKGA